MNRTLASIALPLLASCILTSAACGAITLTPDGADAYERDRTASIDQLVSDLDSPKTLVRCAAVSELARRRAPEAADQIARLLSDKEQLVRLEAAISLVNLADQRGVPVLQDVVREPAKLGVLHSLRAAVALAECGYQDGMALASAYRNGKNWVTRRGAIDVLSRSKDDETAYAALQAGLQDKEPFVRGAAVDRAGDRTTPRSLELLKPLLKDEDHVIRQMVATAMGRMGLFDAIPLLIDALDTSDISQSISVAQALRKITGRVFPEGADETAERSKPDWAAWWAANSSRFPPGGRSVSH